MAEDPLCTPFGDDGASSFINIWAHTFGQAVYDWNFKNGASKDKITEATPPLTSVSILLESHLLTKEEKIHLEQLRQCLIIAEKRGSRLTIPEVLKLSSLSWPVEDMFDADRKKQGQYVPPAFTAYKLDKNHQVTKTFEIIDDGVKETDDGKIGRIPWSSRGVQ